MKRILVIADDLSGASEIAGIATRFGLKTQLHRSPTSDASAEVTVLDTDSRSMNAQDAADAACAFAKPLAYVPFDLIYKKTDSVLRGQPRSEIEAIVKVFDRKTCRFLPQNPSRNRTIKDGIYRIDGKPLHETAFANDPEYPAKTSVARDLLGASEVIALCEAESITEVEQHANALNQTIQLLAGGADFFEAILKSRGTGFQPVSAVTNHGQTSAISVASDTHATRMVRGLWVCGSHSAYSKELIDIATTAGFAVSRLPQNTHNWPDEIRHLLEHHNRVLVCIDRKLDAAPGASERLRQTLAQLTKNIIENLQLDHLCLEGGATAASVCDVMDWNDLEVVKEIAPGIVCLRPALRSDLNVFIKPGSYRWPESMFA